MYADHTLTPREAIRLCALGLLAAGPKPYDEVVFGVRHFVSRLSGPSLELMGESIELLRYEGLVAHESTGGGDAAPAAVGRGDNIPLVITESGRAVLAELLAANVRAGSGAMNDLIFALKMRFLHLLPPSAQRAQLEVMIEACESELARIEDVSANESGHLAGWLAIEATRLGARIAYLKSVLEAAAETSPLRPGGRRG